MLLATTLQWLCCGADLADDDGKLNYRQRTSTINDHETVQSNRGGVMCQQTSQLRGDKICTSAGQSVHKECRYKFCNKNLYLPQSQDGKIRMTITIVYHSSSCAPVNQFFTLLNIIVSFAIILLVYLGTKEVSMFFQSERLDFQTTICALNSEIVGQTRFATE